MTETTSTIKDTNPAMLPRELTLIVAATSKMGIGRNGTLPWTGLKKEMAYFARVTKRASPGTQNTVIMGRKTWDSIPPRFRPLKDRKNIVVSRSGASSELVTVQDHIKVNSMESAITALAQDGGSGRYFVIGGGQIYEAALRLQNAKRILLTRVLDEFECDTHFPVALEEGGTEGWFKASKVELDSWTGETIPEGVQQEGETRYVFEMWQRS